MKIIVYFSPGLEYHLLMTIDQRLQLDEMTVVLTDEKGVTVLTYTDGDEVMSTMYLTDNDIKKLIKALQFRLKENQS